MSCKYCQDGQMKAPVWKIAAIGDKNERYVEVNFCPNCGAPLTEPQPLTLAELEGMDGMLVWIVVTDESNFADPQDVINGWGFVRKSWVRQ